MFLRSALAQERVDDERTDSERRFPEQEETTDEIALLDDDGAPTVAPPDRESGLIAKATRRRPEGTGT
jgi:hypothetical protein